MKNNKEEKNKFASVMYGLSEDFGGTISKDSLSLRFESLKEFSINDISKAGTWLLKNRTKDFPAVPATKEIIDAINRISGNIDVKIKANEQCDIILKYLKYYGRDCEHVFKDSITNYLMTKRWSFFKLDQESIKDPSLKWFRKEFVEDYLDYKKEDVEFLDCRPGSIPIENLKKLLPGE